MTLRDPVNAFSDVGPMPPPAAAGPLAGLTFAVKDLFDVAGRPTRAGSPAWAATHPVPHATAPTVQALLDAGARLLGKTHTDELAWSLNGQNAHYGTPVNVAAPGRIPGGSSSGSAAAAAAGLVDIAIGSDTGGSIRLPASYCGVYGLRTTHSRVPTEGVVALAPSYDTVGWFARDPAVLARVGPVLLPGFAALTGATTMLIADDLFEAAGEHVSTALRPALALCSDLLGAGRHIMLADGRLEAWRDAFRIIQSAEVWRVHGAWVTATNPAFGPGIRERFAAAARLDPAEVSRAQALRETVRQRLADMIPPGTVVLAPSAPGIAPLLTTPQSDLDVFRARSLALLCPAGHGGLPQISLPLARLDGCPLGLAIIAAPHEDERLLDLAVRLADALA